MIRKLILPVALLTLAGCADMTNTQQRALSGTAIGAGTGAVVGAIAGSTGLGLAIGAGAGLVGGLVVDKIEKDRQASFDRGFAAGQASN